MTRLSKHLEAALKKELSPDEFERVAKAMSPRNAAVAIKTTHEKHEAWKLAAQASGMTFVAWVEKHLDAGAKKITSKGDQGV